LKVEKRELKNRMFRVESRKLGYEKQRNDAFMGKCDGFFDKTDTSFD
jgi:hypothetical protein